MCAPWGTLNRAWRHFRLSLWGVSSPYATSIWWVKARTSQLSAVPRIVLQLRMAQSSFDSVEVEVAVLSSEVSSHQGALPL